MKGNSYSIKHCAVLKEQKDLKTRLSSSLIHRGGVIKRFHLIKRTVFMESAKKARNCSHLSRERNANLRNTSYRV